MRISGMRWSLLAVVVISLALVTSGCLRKNKHYTTYSGVDPGMSLAQAKDYCGAIASSAKSGAKSAFQQAQNKKKKKRYWSDGMFVYEQEVSGGFAGGFAEGLAKGLKGNAAYSRVMKGCMAEQGYKLTSKSSTASTSYKKEPKQTTSSNTSVTKRTSTPSLKAKLRLLKESLDEGLISEAEAKEKRAELLGITTP